MANLNIKILVLFFLISSSLFAQNAEQIVKDAERSINQKVAELHELAAQKKIHEAIDKMDEVNKEISKEITWGTFDEKFREAKLSNPGFTFNIKSDLPPQLSPSFWEDFENRCNKILADQEIVIEGMQSAIMLNNFDKVLAYGKQLKTIYETTTGIVENLGTGNLPKFAYDLAQNAKDAIENYEEAENAYIEGLEIEAAKAKWNLTISKTRKNRELYNEFRRYINSNKIAINDFKTNTKYLNTLKLNISSSVFYPLTYADNKYNWNYEKFTKEVSSTCSDFESYDIKCEDFKSKFDDINNRARKDWLTVKGNISVSDDKDKKQEFLDYHTERWTEYLGIVNPIFNKTYDKHCKVVKPEQKVVESKQETIEVPEKIEEKPKSIIEEEEETETSEKEEGKPDQKIENEISITQENKSVTTQTSTIKTSANDKYWENSIPTNADKEWAKIHSKYQIKYSVNGRTVGYRSYDDPDFKLLTNEVLMDNLAIMHGSYRQFSYSNDTEKKWVNKLEFNKLNKKNGPSASFKEDGSVQFISYYIDGNLISESEYRLKAKADPTLVPPDIYKDSKWLKIPEESNMSDPPMPINSDKISFYNFEIPKNAFKYIDAYANSSQEIFHTEKYFLDNNISEPVGERYWSDGILMDEEIQMGTKKLYRKWTKEGELINFTLKIYDNTKGLYTTVGPNYNKSNGLRFYRLDGSSCTYDEYLEEKRKYPQLPDKDIIDLFSTRPAISPNTHPEPKRLNQDVTALQIDDNAKVWRIVFNNDGSINTTYVTDHALAGELSWYDIEMKTPMRKTINLYGSQVLSASWFKDASIKSVDIYGKFSKPSLSITFNEDKSIKKSMYLGVNTSSEDQVNLRLKAYEGISNIPPRNAYLSPNLKLKMSPPTIPASEMTTYFKQIWMRESQEPTSSLIVEQQKMQEKPEEKSDEIDIQSYKELQREELYKLLTEINTKIEAADKSFNIPYWEDSKPSVTSQPTNPKQESLNILRSAVSIIEKAKYPENKGGLYHLVAIKLIDYSGRVFAFNAKQDFFKLAAELVHKSDQLLTSNIFVKDDLSEAYCTSAEVWREMTKKALWGNHAYNKMDCDKMVIQQYEKALQIDPNNQKARKMLENLKRPKPAIPAEADKFDKIEESVWNDAQTIMARLESESLTEVPESNPLPVAELTLTIGDGMVSIMHSGSNQWEKITEPHISIYVGDKIKTSEDAKGVSVTYPEDNAFLAIKNGSEVEFHMEGLYIQRGGTYLQVRKRGTKFLVISPTGAVGIRGTILEVLVGSDKSTETYLYEGFVEVRNSSDIGYLTPGQKMISKKDEINLQIEEFDKTSRLEKEWKTIAIQQQKHEQQVAANPLIKRDIKTTDVAEDTETKTESIPTPTTLSPEVTFSWSPYGSFSTVMVQDEIKFGNHNLIARIPVKFNTNTTVNVKWYLNNSPISEATHTILKEAEFFDGQIVTSGEPINPGNYSVEFIINNKVYASNSITIIAPEKLQQQYATQKYANALKIMQEALDLVDKSDMYNAGIKSSTVLQDLRAIMYSVPQMPDIQAVTEMCLALMTYTEIIHAQSNGANEEAAEWIKRSIGHARRSNQFCKDSQFKISTKKILSILENTFPGY